MIHVKNYGYGQHFLASFTKDSILTCSRVFPLELFNCLLCTNVGLVVSWFAFVPRRFPPWLDETFRFLPSSLLLGAFRTFKIVCTSLFLSWLIAWGWVESVCFCHVRPMLPGLTVMLTREHSLWANPLTSSVWMTRARPLETVSVRSSLEPLKFVFMLSAVFF